MKHITRLLKVKYPKAAFLTQDELASATAAIKKASARCSNIDIFRFKSKKHWSYGLVEDNLVIPRVECIESVYVAMHECGHFAKQHGPNISKCEFTHFSREIEVEREANAFALKLFKTTTTNLKAIATFEKMMKVQIALRVQTLNQNGPDKDQLYFRCPMLVRPLMWIVTRIAKRVNKKRRERILIAQKELEVSIN